MADFGHQPAGQIIIADDNHEFANFVTIVCRREGWVVQTCENGAELIEAVNAGSGPALVLIDINMPEVDGIEAIEGLLDTTRNLRIRFITGGVDSSILAAKMIASARGLHVGKNVFKPLPKADLQKLLADEAAALAELAAMPPPVAEQPEAGAEHR